MDQWAVESHPWLALLPAHMVPYYWSVQEGEYATDIAFRTPEDLRRLYPQLKHYATEVLQGADVLRFLGYRVTKAGQPRRDFAGEVVTTVKELVEGTCVKHRALQNSLKMYDKFGQVLRLENLLTGVLQTSPRLRKIQGAVDHSRGPPRSRPGKSSDKSST